MSTFVHDRSKARVLIAVIGVCVLLLSGAYLEVVPSSGQEILLICWLVVAPLWLRKTRKVECDAGLTEKKALRVAASEHRTPEETQLPQGKRGRRTDDDCRSEAELQSRLKHAMVAGNVSEAEKMVRLIREMGAKVNQSRRGELLTLTSATAKAGDPLTASRWLDLLVKAGLGRPTVISVNMVISAYAKEADVVKAEEWLRRMTTLGLKPEVSTFNSVMDACARARNPARAEHWLLHMPKSCPPDVVSYSTLLHACVRAGDLDLAELWLRRMTSEGEVKPNVICYNLVIHACAQVPVDIRTGFFFL